MAPQLPSIWHPWKQEEPPVLTLSSLRVLVLDEADRLLGEGFEVQLRQILGQEISRFFWFFWGKEVDVIFNGNFSVMCEDMSMLLKNEDFHHFVNMYTFCHLFGLEENPENWSLTFWIMTWARATSTWLHVNCRGSIALSADLAFLGHLACLSAKLLHGSAEGSCGGHSGECNVADFAKAWEFGVVWICQVS